MSKQAPLYFPPVENRDSLTVNMWARLGLSLQWKNTCWPRGQIGTSISEFFSIRIKSSLLLEPVLLFISYVFKCCLFISSAAESNALSNREMKKTESNFAYIAEIKTRSKEKLTAMKLCNWRPPSPPIRQRLLKLATTLIFGAGPLLHNNPLITWNLTLVIAKTFEA